MVRVVRAVLRLPRRSLRGKGVQLHRPRLDALRTLAALGGMRGSRSTHTSATGGWRRWGAKVSSTPAMTSPDRPASGRPAARCRRISGSKSIRTHSTPRHESAFTAARPDSLGSSCFRSQGERSGSARGVDTGGGSPPDMASVRIVRGGVFNETGSRRRHSNRTCGSAEVTPERFHITAQPARDECRLSPKERSRSDLSIPGFLRLYSR